MEHVWCNAAEADTLRRLVENLKDSELDIARREQLANGAWAHDFEEATAKAWSGKVKAASAAEMAAKAELDRKAREAEAAAAVAAAERCRVAAAAVESGELRGELREAMMAAEGSDDAPSDWRPTSATPQRSRRISPRNSPTRGARMNGRGAARVRRERARPRGRGGGAGRARRVRFVRYGRYGVDGERTRGGGGETRICRQRRGRGQG